MVTIYDIAKKAGVSAATVSKVLNGYTDVSAKTATKVQRIATKWAIDPTQLQGD
jgi:LacI family transcriptional regulator